MENMTMRINEMLAAHENTNHHHLLARARNLDRAGQLDLAHQLRALAELPAHGPLARRVRGDLVGLADELDPPR
jgi:hypothetical protein